MRQILLLTIALLTFTAGVGSAQPRETPLPPADRTPQLVINHDGPHAPVTALAFSPDGTLYAGGFHKQVLRYAPRNGKYVLMDGEPIRVPIGPGNAGVVNTIAVSPDGKWIAVAGRAPVRGEVWSGSDDGITVNTRYFPPLLRRDFGVVYLFNREDPHGGKVLRGPQAGVQAIAFATPNPAAGPVLVTASIEWNAEGQEAGTLRVFDVTTGKELAARHDLPATRTVPGLAALASGDNGKTLRVAVAWPPRDFGEGKLLVWEVGANSDKTFADGKANVALAVRVDKDGNTTEILSGGFVGAAGQIVARPANSLAEGKPIPLPGDAGKIYLPVAMSAVGSHTAALLYVLPPPTGSSGRATELRLIGDTGQTLGRIALTGIVNGGPPPVLAVSPDRRFIAVCGFSDNRIEIYDAASLAKGEAKVQKLAGAPGGYTRVAFLNGNRLWLGGADDITPQGGTVFDFTTRKVTVGDGSDKFDGPPQGGTVPFRVPPQTADVVIQHNEREFKFTLRSGEQPTAVALLPAGPSWDKQLGTIVAVAHYHEASASSLITVFDVAGKRQLQLAGPTLRINGLAFSGSRPLLAVVGADRVVSVWSLGKLADSSSAIEGMTMVERDGALAVANFEPNSPASELLNPGDVVTAIGGEKGNLKPVKTYREFLLAVREIPIGGKARVQIKGKAAPVVVPVGRGVGYRHPLFDLWVKPFANPDGTHDWIGWTPAGPYDTNSPKAEAKLGWITATGNPAEPVVYASAEQYRRIYYKPHFLRFLSDEGNFGTALKRYVSELPRTPSTLVMRTDGSEERDGLILQRSRAAGLTISLDDPEQFFSLDSAVVRWRTIDRAGVAGAWQELPFPKGQATIPLPDYNWSRGLHQFEATIHETAELPAAASQALALRFAPAAPTLTLLVNGETVDPEKGIDTMKGDITIGADVKAAPGEKVAVTLTTTGPGGEKPQTLPLGNDGRFGPLVVKLSPDTKTAIRVSAINIGQEVDERESTSVNLSVWHTSPQPKTAPKVRLFLASDVDRPSKSGGPFVSDQPVIKLSANVQVENFEKLEWDDGEGKWVEGTLKKGGVATRDVTIAEGGKPLTMRVRVTGNGIARTDSVSVVWAGLPKAGFEDLPTTVQSPSLIARGPILPVRGGAPYSAQIVVDSPGQTPPRREFEIRTDKIDTWTSTIELAPGMNKIGLVIGNEWKKVNFVTREVRYIRPPVVLGVAPIQARGANVGDLSVAVLSSPNLPPDQFTLADRPHRWTRMHGPYELGGTSVWWLRAESIPLEIDGVLPETVRVAVRNADGASQTVEANVIPKPMAPVPPPPPPPTLSVTTGPDQTPITSGATIRTDQARFGFGVKITSVAKLVRVDFRRTGQTERISGLSLDAMTATPAGFLISAKDRKVSLREGVNAFELEIATEREVMTFPFTVSYTPPPVRVVIDAIEESDANGVFSPVKTAAVGGFVRVRGRVVWAGPGLASKRTGHEVVLIANEVRHLPVELADPGNDATEAGFVAPVFLNAADVKIRVEVNRLGASVARQKVANDERMVKTNQPLSQQRLHVLVVAPQTPADARVELAKVVISAVGGVYPPNDPAGDRGQFKHKAFAGGATLYRPLVQDVSRAHLIGLLNDLESQIRQSAGAPGPRGWVNDLVVIYYRGSDLYGRDGRLRLHTTQSLAMSSPAAAERFTICLDDLPPTPGVRLTVLNIVNPNGAGTGDPVRAGPLLLRYVWQDAKGADALPEFYRIAVNQMPKVGEVVDWVNDMVKKTASTDSPIGVIPGEVRQRPIGVRDAP